MAENLPDKAQNKSEILFYQTGDGSSRIQVRIEGETVWLSQRLLADLYKIGVNTVNHHIKSIYADGELLPEATIRQYRIVQTEGGRQIERLVEHYNLDMILAVGFRVRSQRGVQFRQWATERLREYLIKGFALDDERLKQGGQKARYFQELLQRIRDIRSSERNFYQKVTDIYATSIDYRNDDKLTKEFFATVQNKIHYAVHGQTAAEMIVCRADGTKPLMGLVNFKSNYITQQDAKIAKNYLTEKELNQLNLIVSLYLDFAELQASNGRLMKMKDWVLKLDEFLKVSEKGILTNSGTVSAEAAARKVEEEFEKYRKERDKKIVSDFDLAVKELEAKNKSARGGKSAA